jgi:hypothetical protein
MIASQFERYEGARIFVFDKGYSMYPLVSSCLDAAQEWLEAVIILSKGSLIPQF